jgi:hypothetical protein
MAQPGARRRDAPLVRERIGFLDRSSWRRGRLGNADGEGLEAGAEEGNNTARSRRRDAPLLIERLGFLDWSSWRRGQVGRILLFGVGVEDPNQQRMAAQAM